MLVRLDGGLGNQMFIYAFAKSLSLKGNPILLDATAYDKDVDNKNDGNTNKNIRLLELDLFNISIPLCFNRYEIKDYIFKHDMLLRLKLLFHYFYYEMKGKHNKYYLTMLKFYKNRCKETKHIGENQILNRFIENNFHPHAYCDGIFQNLAYFESIDSIIREEFALKEPLKGHNAEWEKKILSTKNSVFLHVRLGDYIGKETNGLFVSLGKTYYQSAINIMKEKLGNPYIFIFSNDIEWCEKNLCNALDFSGCNMEFVKGNDEGNAAYEMQLMRSCKNAITANSTFSWWAAYLMDNADKCVIIPNQIFNDTTRIPSIDMLHKQGFIKIDSVWGNVVL